MAGKHLLIVDKKPTDAEFLSDTWTNRKPYVGLVKNGGGVDTNEVFYNFTGTKVTKLKVKIENPGYYGFGYIDGYISKDKPTIINWGNGTTTTLTTPITNEDEANSSTDYYVNYPKAGEYEISIDGWYICFKCYGFKKSGMMPISNVLIEIIQVSSLITSFYETFRNCSSLTSIPSNLFDNNTGIIDFRNTFSYCKSLANIPSGLFDNNTSVTSFSGTFCGCSSLANIPSGLFDNNTGVTQFGDVFSGCSSIKSIPSGLFDNNIKVTMFYRTFEDCSNLASIPSGLFDKNVSVTSFSNTFIGCKSLAGETPYTLSSDNKKIKLWDRDGTNGFVKPEGVYVFARCTKLTDYEDIPIGWK